jgi:hypothetical protein
MIRDGEGCWQTLAASFVFARANPERADRRSYYNSG